MTTPATCPHLMLFWLAVVFCGLACPDRAAFGNDPSRPNVVVMLADDMGFGEIRALNPHRGQIPTPQLDAIAAAGMVFTDAHGGSSVCTPTRYGLLTGRYAFRTRLQSGVVTGGESLIAADRWTLAKLFRQAGYHTAVIGKWHLGMLFDGEHRSGEVPLGSHVTHGPLDRGGFDEFRGFHHSRQIRTWIENDRVTETLEPIEMLPRLTRSAVEYIAGRDGQEQPFFLFVPWSSPHSPVVPTPRWQGKSGLNPHADFVMQTDDSFGQVVRALKEHGFWENTLVICSSDNGTSGPTANIGELRSLGHFPSGDLRGSKADIWDGGHRVPMLATWPGRVPPGSRYDGLVCLGDLMRTFADLFEIDLPDDAAEDSVSFLPALRGEPAPARTDVIHHSIHGYFAIRRDRWKLALCPGSGGWSDPRPTPEAWRRARESATGTMQLYDMHVDIGERRNLADRHPDLVAELSELLRTQVDRGRSTPGPAQPNDAPIVVDKGPRPGRE